KSEPPGLVRWCYPPAFGAKRRASYAPITISPAAALSFGRRRAGDFSSDFLDSEKCFRGRGRGELLGTWTVWQSGCGSAGAGLAVRRDNLYNKCQRIGKNTGVAQNKNRQT